MTLDSGFEKTTSVFCGVVIHGPPPFESSVYAISVAVKVQF